jgi:hypothetical protein
VTLEAEDLEHACYLFIEKDDGYVEVNMTKMASAIPHVFIACLAPGIVLYTPEPGVVDASGLDGQCGFVDNANRSVHDILVGLNTKLNGIDLSSLSRVTHSVTLLIFNHFA